jgi:hypothetical protein
MSIREEEGFINRSGDLGCRARIFECGGYIDEDQELVQHLTNIIASI